MSSDSPRKQQISVLIDTDLIEQVDRLTGDRDRAIVEGLKLWCDRQADNELQQSARLRQQRHDRDETGWLV